MHRFGSFVMLAGTFALNGCGNGEDIPVTFDDEVFESSLEAAEDHADSAEAERGTALDSSYNVSGALLADGCVEITTDPDPLPDPLPASYTVTYAFDQCPIGRGRTQSGTRVVAVTRNEDGSRDFAVTRDLTRNRLDGSTVDIDSQGSMHAVGARSEGTVERSLSYSGTRVRTVPAGDTAFTVEVDFPTVTAVDTFGSSTLELTERVVDGAGTIHSSKRDVDVAVSMAGLTLQRALCCYPIAGIVSLVVSRDGEVLRERNYTFTECGKAELGDGTAIELQACRGSH